MPKMTLQLGDTSAEIHVSRQGDRLQIKRDDTSAEIEIVDSSPAGLVLAWLRPDGQRERVRLFGATNGDRRQLWVNGRSFEYELIRQRAAGGSAEGALSSSIPAVVSQVLTAVGNTVDPGEKLLLLESMKMVIPIQAPHAGTVTAIHCAAGDSVQAGVVLVEIEEE